MKNHDSGDDQASERLALGVLAHLEDTLVHNPPPEHLGRRIVGWGTVILVVFMLVWAGASFFSLRYSLLNAKVNAFRTSTPTLKQLINTQTTAYRLTIIQPNGQEQKYSLADLGMTVDIDKSIAAAHTQRLNASNILEWWRPIPLQLVLKTDEAKLQKFADGHGSLTIQSPKDATLTITNGVVQLNDSQDGKQYILPDAMHVITSAASSLQSNPLTMRIVSQPPHISTGDLADSKTRLDATLQQPITFTIGSLQVHPSPADVADWLNLTPTDKRIVINVNADRVNDYLNKLATSKQVTVTNKAATVDTLVNKLIGGQGLQLTLNVQKSGGRLPADYFAGKWIEVDTTAKRLYAYQQSTLVRTFLISAGAPGTPTVTGTFAIYSKYTKQTMSGPNVDGSRYVQPNVPWVNYFYSDYAIHGNYWRPTSYFGNVNSSHGCVGLLVSDSAWIYSWAPIGTPVVVHR